MGNNSAGIEQAQSMEGFPYSEFEQKAIVILLTLLSLGVKNIYTGPTAPAFLTDNLLAIFNEKFGMHPITTVEQNLQDILTA